MRDLRRRGDRRGPAYPVLAWHTCSAAAPVWAVHGGSAACLFCFCMHIHNILTVHLWRVVLWLEYFWRVRYAAISLLVPVGELPPLQSTSVRI